MRIILFFLLTFLSLEAKNIKHIINRFYATNYRIFIDAIIEEKSGIEDARVYFKSSKKREYLIYAPMKCKDIYCRAILPKPNRNRKNIFYKIIYQNNSGYVYSSDEVVMQKRDLLELKSYQTKDNKKIIFKTDLVKAPKEIYGFDDNFEIKTIPKSERIGVLAKIIKKEFAGIKDEEREINGKFGSKVGLMGEESSIYGTIAIVFLLFLIL